MCVFARVCVKYSVYRVEITLIKTCFLCIIYIYICTNVCVCVCMCIIMPVVVRGFLFFSSSFLFCFRCCCLCCFGTAKAFLCFLLAPPLSTASTSISETAFGAKNRGVRSCKGSLQKLLFFQVFFFARTKSKRTFHIIS